MAPAGAATRQASSAHRARQTDRMAGRHSLTLRTAALAALMTALAGQAGAQDSSRCWLLEQELAGYERAATNTGPQLERIDRAIREQQQALAKTENAGRRLGCFKRGFLFFQPSKPPECRQIETSVDQMRANLAQLESERDRLSAPVGDNDPGKRRILALLAENQCGPQYARFRDGGRQTSIFGTWLEEDEGPSDRFRGGFGGLNRMLGGIPTYRTLCVRSCDGYYFPISFATLPQRFEQDAEQCRAMCPSAIVELYVHENPGATVEEAVSLNGRPYTTIPTAFRYRKEYVQGCSCNLYSLALEKTEDEAAAGITPAPGAALGTPALQLPADEAGDGEAAEEAGVAQGEAASQPDGGGEPLPNIIRMTPPGEVAPRIRSVPSGEAGRPFRDPVGDR